MAVTAALTAIVISACDSASHEAPKHDPRVSGDSTLARLKEAHRATARTSPVRTQGGESKHPGVVQGSQRIELPGGVVVVTPPAPSVTATGPETGCTVVNGPDHQPLGIPPAPGITARRIAPGKFAITYEFAVFDPRCRPSQLRVSVDVNDDPLPPSGTEASIQGRRGRIIVSVPALVADADVARATAMTAARLTSRSTSVLIR